MPLKQRRPRGGLSNVGGGVKTVLVLGSEGSSHDTAGRGGDLAMIVPYEQAPAPRFYSRFFPPCYLLCMRPCSSGDTPFDRLSR